METGISSGFVQPWVPSEAVAAVMVLNMERSGRPSTQLGCEAVRMGQSSWFTELGEGWRHFPTEENLEEGQLDEPCRHAVETSSRRLSTWSSRERPGLEMTTCESWVWSQWRRLRRGLAWEKYGAGTSPGESLTFGKGEWGWGGHRVQLQLQLPDFW